MIRKTIVFSVYISLITGLVEAVDVNIPGADNRISANAYESYIHHDSLIRNIQEEALRDFQKSKQYDETKQLYIDNGLSEKEDLLIYMRDKQRLLIIVEREFVFLYPI